MDSPENDPGGKYRVWLFANTALAESLNFASVLCGLHSAQGFVETKTN